MITRALVHPLIQITHQHGTASNVSIEPDTSPVLFVYPDPCQSLREKINQHPTLAAPIPESTKSGDLGPDLLRSINPFFFSTLWLLSLPKYPLLHYDRDRYVTPSQLYVSEGRSLCSTSGAGRPQ